jgi:hypothetical protein
MKLRFATIALAASALFFAATSLHAQAPAGSTGVCNDGSYWTGATKSGACRGHKGVKTWFGTSTAVPVTKPASTAVVPTQPVNKSATAPLPSVAVPPAPKRSMPAPQTAQAPGGGAGMVWVNMDSKVYHCPGDRYYGKTKSGKYMSESDAKAMGAHADANKPCK